VTPADAALRTRATYASVGVATTLVSIKFAAWLGTGSVAMLSSLVDSALDAVASIVNLIAVRHALAPADYEHRFGHGKAEPLAALGQAAFLAGGAALLTVEAIARIINPVPVVNAVAGIAVMLVSIALSAALVAYQRRIIARTRSLAIGADELHYRSDLVVNGGVVAALLIDRFVAAPVLDALIGAAIGLWIIWGSVHILRLSLTQLMDRELPDADRARIRKIVEGIADVAAIHDLRTRAAGPTAFIQLHLELDGRITLAQAHEIADRVEKSVRDAYPHAEIIVHQEPADIADPRQVFPRAG
jgi:ferrous-iron efflux pump FieF